METLEAELLAVTEHRGKNSRKEDDDSDASASAGELDGVVDSDGAEEDPLDDAHDDDADDDEYGIDDDDDDDEFATGRASKKKTSRNSRTKRPSNKSAPASKNRSRTADRKSSRTKPGRSSSGELGEYDTDQFYFEYDEDGYGDADDREHLSKMSEFDREIVLSERKDARNKRLLIWQKKRELMARDAEGQNDLGSGRARSSTRSKVQSQSKTDALQALAADKRKKSSRAITLDDVSDADSELDERPKESKSPQNKSQPVQETKTDEDLLKESKGPDLRFDDLVKSVAEGEATTTTPLFLRRDTLVHLSQKPYFDRVIQGLYVRPRVGAKDNSYLLCRIVGVRTGRVYELVDSQMNKFKTNKFLILLSGKQRKLFEIRLVSGSHPRQHEFEVYVTRAKEGGTEIPRREEVERLLKESTINIFQGRAIATDEERKDHIANMEQVYPARVNWTKKRTELETALDIKRQDIANAREVGKEEEAQKLTDEMEDMETRLKEIRAMEKKYVIHEKTSSVEVFENLARRNMKLNATNESLAAKRRSLEAGKASYDMSRDGMIQPLFSKIDKGGDKIGNGSTADQHRGWSASDDWRNELVTWSPSRKREKLGDHPLTAGYDVAVPSMEDVVLDDKQGVQAKNSVSMVPPGIDAVYDRQVRPTVKAPQGGKVISFEEWSRQRAA